MTPPRRMGADDGDPAAGILAAVRHVPEPEEAFERLRDRWERGSAALRDEESGAADWWAELAERLGPDGAEFVVSFEEHVNAQADRWGRDRFRLGFAVAASGLLDAVDD